MSTMIQTLLKKISDPATDGLKIYNPVTGRFYYTDGVCVVSGLLRGNPADYDLSGLTDVKEATPQQHKNIDLIHGLMATETSFHGVINLDEYKAVMKLKKVRSVECGRCGGHGEITCDLDHEHYCPDCDGYGSTHADPPVYEYVKTIAKYRDGYYQLNFLMEWCHDTGNKFGVISVLDTFHAFDAMGTGTIFRNILSVAFGTALNFYLLPTNFPHQGEDKEAIELTAKPLKDIPQTKTRRSA